MIDEELRKEYLASSRPIRSLKYSGLGVIPKKSGKWRMILHLSTSLGRSIHISKEDFLFVMHPWMMSHMLSALGKGALMAKVDLKSAFRNGSG